MNIVYKFVIGKYMGKMIICNRFVSKHKDLHLKWSLHIEILPAQQKNNTQFCTEKLQII